MTPLAYRSFLLGIEPGAAPICIYGDPLREGDVYVTLWRGARPSTSGRIPEAFGVLLWCSASCIGVDPLDEVGPDYAVDLAPRRLLREAIKQEIEWFTTPEKAVEALGGPRWGMGCYGRLMAYRVFRDLAAEGWGVPAPERCLGIDENTYKLIEYDPEEGFEGWALIPEIALYVAQLPLAARTNYGRLHKAALKGESGEGRKAFHCGYEWGFREDHDEKVATLDRNIGEVIEAAVELCGDSVYIDRRTVRFFECWQTAKKAAAPRCKDAALLCMSSDGRP